MSPDRSRRSRSRRAWIAVGVALAVHVALLGAMGLVRPRFAGRAKDLPADLQLQLLPQSLPKGSEPVTAGARQRRREALAASPLAQLINPSPAPADDAEAPAQPAPGAATGAGASSGPEGAGPDCDPEDLPLLTAEEKARCRNQIEVARARRVRALDEAGLADRVASLRNLPRVDGLPLNKRAYYDAVQSAKATRDSFAVWDRMRQGGRSKADLTETKIVKPDIHDVVTCTTKFGVNKGKPAGSRYGSKLGPFDCPLAPAPSFLTEEARVAPP